MHWTWRCRDTWDIARRGKDKGGEGGREGGKEGGMDNTLRTPKMRLPVVVVWMPTSKMARKGFFS
jgi:hypothetical protein